MDKNSNPVSEIQIFYKNIFLGKTNDNGTIFISEDKSFEIIQLRDNENSTIQGLRLFVNNVDFGQSDNKGNVFLLGIAKVDLLISVTDIVGGKVSGAEIFLDDELLGKSNEKGELDTNLDLNIGEHQIRVVKENNEGIEPPMVSVVTEVDGKLYLVNHWPPGFCVVLMVFYKMGIVQYTNIILSALACISVYGITRRIFDYKTAFIAVILMMTTALAMYMVYSVEMADYATMAFAILGFWLFIEGVYSKEKYLSILFLILGGLLISTAVTMRYSTVVVAICPIVFLLVKMLKGEKSKKIKFVPSKKEFIKNLKLAVPYIVGVAIIGIILANYNNTYFGSPFNSGYQMERSVDVDTKEIEEGNATINEPSESFFKQYFSLKKESFEKFPRKLTILFYVMPVIFLTPIALKRWKNPLIISMAVWIILILFIYGSLSWVADWDDHRRTLEDMRYFLPILPAAAILGGFSIRQIFKGSDIKKILGIIVVFSLIISGAVVADFQIDNQSIRGGPKQQNPNIPKNEEYQSISISELINNPQKSDRQNILVTGKVISIQTDSFIIEDKNQQILIRTIVLNPQNPQPQPIPVNDVEIISIDDNVNVGGRFIITEKANFIEVKIDTTDFIKVLGKTNENIEYIQIQIKELNENPEKYNNTFVKIDGIIIWKSNDLVEVFESVNIIVFFKENDNLEIGDVVKVSGQFRFNNKLDIRIRENTEDSIEVLEKMKISGIEYPKYKIDALLKDIETFENNVINIENATITKELKDNEVIKIKDNSTNEEIVVILDEKIELNENDKIDVQGKFRQPKDEDKEWEINIRRDSGDKIEVL